MATLTLERLKDRAANELAERSFIDFLRYVKISTAKSAEEYDSSAVAFERWPYLMERAEAWERGDSEVILKARQLGFTWLAAAYAVWRARRQGSLIPVISQGENYAQYFVARCKFINSNLPERLRRTVATDNAEELVFQRGGTIKAMPSTANAGRSFDASLVIVDEAAYHPFAAVNYSGYRPSVADAGGQLLIMSTSSGSTGFFANTWKAAQDGRLGYTAVFEPWWQRPGRNTDWFEKERQNWLHLSDAEFRREYPGSPDDAWTAQTGLVFPEFDFSRHVRPIPPFSWERYKWRFIGIDPGGGDPTAIVPLGAYRDKNSGQVHYHQVAEFYQRNADFEQILSFLARWPAPNAIFVDTAGGETLLNTLKRYGYLAFPAPKGRAIGIQFYRELLKGGRLTHSPECVNAIAEYSSYRWAERMDPSSRDSYATATPVDHHADAKDALRYAIVGSRTMTERGAVVGGDANRKMRMEYA
jgi:hypothetical protein